jgi:membrane protein YdbS with pleckstrin-like domain
MDSAIFMERYGYRLLMLLTVAVILGVALAPFVMTFWAFSSDGLAVAVTAAIVLGICVLLMSVPKFWEFAHKMRQTHVLEDWSRDED